MVMVGKTTERIVATVLMYLAVVVVMAATLFPLVWMFITSFKKETDVLTFPPTFVFEPTFDNFIYAFTKSKPPLSLALTNSLIIGACTVALVVPISALAAYSFARFNVGGGHLQFYILTVKMFPAIAAIIPYFIIFRELGLLDHVLSLIILNTLFNLPFAIWLLFGFFREIPQDLEESAMIEGCSKFGAFRDIVLPLIAPGLAVTAIFSTIFTWNEFLFAFILSRARAVTAPVAVAGFWTQRGILWGPLSAAATICIVPMFIFALLIQRYIVRGLTFGAVK